MKEIIIPSQNVSVYVDDTDYNNLLAFSWWLTNKGYACTTIWDRQNKKRQNILMHRLLMNAKKGEIIDHINGDKLDNRRSNLRLATIQQNAWNQNKRILNNLTSKYKGVSLQKRKIRKRWLAMITINHRTRIIGSFETEIEAAYAYDQVAVEIFGEYARVNMTRKVIDYV